MGRSWDPIRDLVLLQDRMNRLFQEAARERGRTGEEESEQEIEHADWTPHADVYQSDKEYTIELDLPGIDRAALDISIDNDKLLIRGVRAIEQETRHRRERPHGRFLRRFTVPANIDQKAISAEYKDGVLRVRLPKRKAPQAQKVEIKVS